MSQHGVAVTVPEPWSTSLQSAREEFGDPQAAAIPPHVTLLPPTVIADDLMDGFLDHVRQVASAREPFEMVLSGTGTFRPISPVVFVQVSSGISSCEALERAVRSGPVARPLDFPYHPHVTVAHHLDEPALDRAFESLAAFRCEFPVTTVELYHQSLDGVWRAVDSFPLGGDVPAPTTG